MQSEIFRLYQRLFDRMERHRRFVLWAAVLVVATCSAFLPIARLDMSFNPFFADDAESAAATEALEEVFGRRLGAYVGVVIENDYILSAGFLRRLETVSRRVEALDDVTEVISLSRSPVPVWNTSGVHTELLMAVDLLDDTRRTSPTESLLSYDAARDAVLSRDGKRTLLLARIDLRLDDMDGRSKVIDAFRSTVTDVLGASSRLRFVGYSVVEDQFAGIVLRSLAQTFVLTFLALSIILWLSYGRFSLVFAGLAGVLLATPASVGIMVMRGQAITMINSMVPVVILIVGAADAIHMIQSFLVARRRLSRREAVRHMFAETGLPCFLTTVTTVGGFLGLCMAQITAIRDFGLNVAIGLVGVYLINLVVLPEILRVTSDVPAGGRSFVASRVQRWASATADVVARRSALIITAFVAFLGIVVVSIPQVELNQLVNGEVSESEPVRADQRVLESNFGGFLGPDVAVRRKDGAALTSHADISAIRTFASAVSNLENVDRVASFADLLPPEMPPAIRPALLVEGLSTMRADPRLRLRLESQISGDLDQASVAVYVSDIGTRAAEALVAAIDDIAQENFGPEYETVIYGQWWLAQIGMQNMSHDMVYSFATSVLLVLPILALALSSLRLLLVSLVPNLLPVAFALAFSVWMGIPIRIGTSMVLAIAFGIAVDDTIHLMMRLKREEMDGKLPLNAIHSAVEGAGAAILYTSVVLVVGFLTMIANDLLVIRDMGVLASATLLVAFLADVYLAPALYLQTCRLWWGREATREHTKPRLMDSNLQAARRHAT